ncbi:E3 ubiquitin-protein ligase Trim36-like [Mytilus californianus]|uniref:E3 ubiquitin-protein ligase Trim36-like n=1 Tax=Mytilus californianus TaxID=6549 RepID=UPI0022452E6E|nr:E3 ubiquitin-protein ligase Trim36-like [Mytilus californianus]
MATAQSLKTGQAPVECHFCKGGTKIRWKCLNCDVSMCNRCKDNVHSKLKIDSQHVVVDIKELGKHGKIEDAFPFSEVKCNEHKGQVCCLFCKTCRLLICPKCMVKVHNGHQLIEDEEYNKKRENLKAEQMRIEEILYNLVIDKEKLTKMKEAENDKYAIMKKEILAQKNRLLEELSHRWKSISNAIEQKEFQVEEEMKQIQMRNGNVKNLITTKDFGYFFEQVDKIQTSGEKAMPPTGSFNVSSMPTYIPGKIVKLYAEQPGNIEFKISNECTTDLKHIHYIAVCSDGTIWIADNVSAKLQHVKLEGKSEVISNLNIEIFGLAATVSNDALIATIGKKLKIVSSKTGQITDSIYAESSLFPSSIHITKDGKII